MTTYYFSSSFKFGGNSAGIHSSVSRWIDDLDGFEIKFRSSPLSGVPATDFFDEALSDFQEESVELAFTLQQGTFKGRGKLVVVSPIIGDYSKVELQFSLDDRFRGLFASASEVVGSLVACCVAFNAEVGQVEAEDFSDEESSRKYQVFQKIVRAGVPVNFEWVNVFRRDIFASIGWRVPELQMVEGVIWGETADYVWVLLTERPFSYTHEVGTVEQNRVEEALRLKEKQTGDATAG